MSADIIPLPNPHDDPCAIELKPVPLFRNRFFFQCRCGEFHTVRIRGGSYTMEKAA
jgi:hypothetical protein